MHALLSVLIISSSQYRVHVLISVQFSDKYKYYIFIFWIW